MDLTDMGKVLKQAGLLYGNLLGKWVYIKGYGKLYKLCYVPQIKIKQKYTCY